jgi:hypothetical protein
MGRIKISAKLHQPVTKIQCDWKKKITSLENETQQPTL